MTYLRDILQINSNIKPYGFNFTIQYAKYANTYNANAMVDQIVNTKYRYKALIQLKAEKPYSEELIRQLLCNFDITFSVVYQNKIGNMIDKKLAEFNYKTLHLILPCNKNLKKWGKQDDDKCNICGEVEDIPHLLYYCDHARMIWKFIQTYFSEAIDLQSVILGNNNMTFNTITSMFAFLIYKEWLIAKNENTSRAWPRSVFFFSNESTFRSSIYYQIKQPHIGKILSNISYKLKR